MSKKVTDLPEILTLADADQFLIADASDGLSKRVRRDNVLTTNVLWAWNKLDASQFDVAGALNYDDSVASPAAGSVTVSVITGAYRGGNVLEFDATTLRGGLVVPVLQSELSLPSRYTIRAHILEIDGTLAALLAPFGMDDGAGQWRGALVRRIGGGGQYDATVTTDNSPTSGQTLRSSGVSNGDALGVTWNATAVDRGGAEVEVDVWRQEGAASNDWLLRYKTHEPATLDAGELARQDVSSFADTAPDWDGEDLELFGIGIDSDSTAQSGTVVFADLQVLRHPLDRT